MACLGLRGLKDTSLDTVAVREGAQWGQVAFELVFKGPQIVVLQFKRFWKIIR